MKGLHQQSSLLSALTKQNVVPSDKAENISVDFIQQKKPFIRYLVEDKDIDAEAIANTLCRSFGCPLIDLANFDTSLVPEEIGRAHV